MNLAVQRIVYENYPTGWGQMQLLMKKVREFLSIDINLRFIFKIRFIGSQGVVSKALIQVFRKNESEQKLDLVSEFDACDIRRFGRIAAEEEEALLAEQALPNQPICVWIDQVTGQLVYTNANAPDTTASVDIDGGFFISGINADAYSADANGGLIFNPTN